MTTRGDITRALGAARQDAHKAEELVALVYEQLGDIARARMAGERKDHTLQATALVHEAFARLMGSSEQSFEDRSQFFIAASEAMRRVLVDHARKRGAQKRGGLNSRIPLDVLDLASDTDPDHVLALDDALDRLRTEDRQAAAVVQLRFFAGLSVAESAACLGVSERTVARDWVFSRARLAELLGSGNRSPS